MSAIIAPTSLPATAPVAAPIPVTITTAPPIVGYSAKADKLADYSTAFAALTPGAGGIPVVLTPTPAPGKRKTMTSLEILLISTAVAVGVVTLCLLISVQKSR